MYGTCALKGLGISTPISKGQHLIKKMCSQVETEIEEMKIDPYFLVVGSLMYVMTSTRYDICHAVRLVSIY